MEHRKEGSVAEAIQLLNSNSDAKILAGGHRLIPLMKLRLARPGTVIDIGGIEELKGISVENGTLRIGALTRMSRLERYEELRRYSPLLAEAIPWVAHPQIRNRSTLGGTLSHADPAAEVPAVCLAASVPLFMMGGVPRPILATLLAGYGLWTLYRRWQGGWQLETSSQPVVSE